MFLSVVFAHAQISNLRCEYLVNPLSVDAATPRFTWENAVDQQYFQLRIATDKNLLKDGQPDIWQSGKMVGNNNLIIFEEKKLQSHSTYYWQISVWNKNGKRKDSPIAVFETAKMFQSDWKAKWISDEFSKEYKPSLYFRPRILRSLY
jgi:alpha-L-rhamnosidase